MKPAQAKLSKIDRLHTVYERVKHRFHHTHQEASDWLKVKSIDVEDFRTKSQQLLAATSLAGSMMLHQPVDAQVLEKIQSQEDETQRKQLAQASLEEQELVISKLKSIVQMPPGNLNKEDELYMEQQLTDMLGFSVTAELDGNRLNHTIGIMGGEQHLRRYPTDALQGHDAYQESGIAPNRGAFGWFTENGELTNEAVQREKYYFAVQTLYLPNWNSDHQQLKTWYKFRKMIAINPAEETAVVGVVGDAGPAEWVKKQYGGSPEVIREGKIWSQKSRGRVILLFVEDPENKIPLGSIPLRQLPKQISVAE
jgi:hypothetical protein